MSLFERVLAASTADDVLRHCLEMEPGFAELTVSGSCMEPALKPGARVVLRAPSPPPGVGDVVLFRAPSGLRLHRVVFRSRAGLRTKGDRGIYLDPVVADCDVLGVWQTEESRIAGAIRVCLSLARLLKRPWLRPAVGVTEHTLDSCHRAKV